MKMKNIVTCGDFVLICKWKEMETYSYSGVNTKEEYYFTQIQWRSCSATNEATKSE